MDAKRADLWQFTRAVFFELWAGKSSNFRVDLSPRDLKRRRIWQLLETKCTKVISWAQLIRSRFLSKRVLSIGIWCCLVFDSNLRWRRMEFLIFFRLIDRIKEITMFIGFIFSVDRVPIGKGAKMKSTVEFSPTQSAKEAWIA